MTVKSLLFEYDKVPFSFHSHSCRLFYETCTSPGCLIPIRSFALNPEQEYVYPQLRWRHQRKADLLPLTSLVGFFGMSMSSSMCFEHSALEKLSKEPYRKESSEEHLNHSTVYTE
jgi:hypothetical protein